MNKKYLIVFSLITILLCFMIVSAAWPFSITGKAVDSIYPARNVKLSCMDNNSSVAVTYSVKGIQYTKTLQDSCENEAKTDYYCSRKTAKLKTQKCTCNSEGTDCSTETTPSQATCSKTGSVVSGTNDVGSFSVTDFCKGDNFIEYSCSEANLPMSNKIECKKGGCVNGICEPKYPYCSDTDEGKNYLSAGKVISADSSGKKTTNADKCDSTTTLTEWYCEGNEAKSESHVCEAGQTCLKGVCAGVKCTDSDNGKDFNIRGTVIIENVQISDFCDGQKSLVEFACSKKVKNGWGFAKSSTQSSRVQIKHYNCKYGCVDGACAASQEGTADTESATASTESEETSE